MAGLPKKAEARNGGRGNYSKVLLFSCHFLRSLEQCIQPIHTTVGWEQPDFIELRHFIRIHRA
jgi:hypothetical protein